jgi:uncharacterized protein
MTRDRDIADIPEVFRRAFENEGWGTRDGGDNDGGGGQGGNGRGAGRPLRVGRWFWLSALVLILLLSFNWIVTTYTEWLWFSALNYPTVWLTQWGVRIGVFVAFFFLAALILLANWRIAFRAARRITIGSRLRLLDLPGVGWLLSGTALFLAFIFASAAGASWNQILLFFNRQPFGASDPVFGRDLSFYLFELPVYRFLHGWLVPLLILALLGVAGLYLVDSWTSLRQSRQRTLVPPALRRHLSLLGAIIFTFWAAGLFLGTFELLYSTRGVIFGAGYTDLQAQLPVLYGQTAIMIVLAIVTAINIFRPVRRPLVVVAGLYLVVSIVGGNVYPSLLQRYAVEPTELSREWPYIEHNIAYTRLGFGLDGVEVRPFGEVEEISRQDLLDHEGTLRNVRLWDYRPLQQTYSQLQALRPYYRFASIDIDRYNIEGEVRQVMLAGRELDKSNLTAPSWVNLKLEFTHGYGVVMNPVDTVTPEGRPEFFLKDLPPQSTVSLSVDRPEIYYGELMTDVVFAGSDLEEFDYPLGAQNAYSSYDGDGGVTLSNIWRRLAFAIRFGEVNLLLSDYITPQTRVLMHRQVQDRVRQIAPFLTLDYDPYLVVSEGRLIWLQDAYMTSRYFPYATPVSEGFNYIRNSVKATVDAYDGTVRFYIAAPEDPLIRAYSGAFPDLFLPLEAMPEALQAHIRYPEGLFLVQARQYLRYHMEEVQVFYNQEDLWQIPQEIFDNTEQLMEPYYVIMSLPGHEETEFLLIQPYTPAGRNNMIAWLAARNDMPHYGELVVYELPKQQLIFGPQQIEARIDQDPLISAQISLWNQRGSRVIRGNLIVIPMNNSFLYIEPLYLLASTSELPELRRVIVASGDKLVMRETLDDALVALMEDAPSVDTVIAELPIETANGFQSEADQTAIPVPPEMPAAPVETSIEALIRSANAHYEAALAAQRTGNWAVYGSELAALERDLQQLMLLLGEP